MKTPAGLLPSRARSRGLVQLAPAGEARPRVRNVGSARPAAGGGGGGNARGLAGAHGHPRALLAHGASELAPLRVRPELHGRRGGERIRARHASRPSSLRQRRRRRRFIDLQRRRSARAPPKARRTGSRARRPPRGEMNRDGVAEKPGNGRECGPETEGGLKPRERKRGA